MNRAEFRAKIKALEPFDSKEQRNNLVCALIGHSRISTMCFGYRNCARCGEQLGDSLGSIDFGKKEAVVVGHNCDTCRSNYEKCTWKDKLYVPNPFLEQETL